MASNRKVVTRVILATMVQSAFLFAAATSSRAETASPPDDESVLATDAPDSTAAPAEDLTGEPPAADPAAADTTKAGTASPDSLWHFSVSPYLWLAGVHGSLGALGRDVGFKASPADLLSHFRFGVLGAVEARRGWLVLTNDLLYMRLGANNALPPPRLNAITANVTANVVILTPKIGARLVDHQNFKFDALWGFRFWHFGESLNFSPGLLGLNYSASQNWVSPLVGSRMELPLSPKLSVTALGDVGGWGTGAQLEYQVAGFIGYKVKPKWTMQAGYRYLNENYRGSGDLGAVAKLTMSGFMMGITRDLSKQ